MHQLKHPFGGNLTTGEIVSQILFVEKDLNIRISNVVFMGIGEPLDNFENVIKAVKNINDYRALNIGARKISISTCGVVPKIYEIADLDPQFVLSISLHAATDEKRSKIMPINNRYNLKELMEACNYYINKTKKRISFEYALISGLNDNIDDAKELVKLIKNMKAHVNLIPINETKETDFKKAKDEKVMEYRDYLNKNGIVATIRRELRKRY